MDFFWERMKWSNFRIPGHFIYMCRDLNDYYYYKLAVNWRVGSQSIRHLFLVSFPCLHARKRKFSYLGPLDPPSTAFKSTVDPSDSVHEHVLVFLQVSSDVENAICRITKIKRADCTPQNAMFFLHRPVTSDKQSRKQVLFPSLQLCQERLGETCLSQIPSRQSVDETRARDFLYRSSFLYILL